MNEQTIERLKDVLKSQVLKKEKLEETLRSENIGLDELLIFCLDKLYFTENLEDRQDNAKIELDLETFLQYCYNVVDSLKVLLDFPTFLKEKKLNRKRAFFNKYDFLDPKKYKNETFESILNANELFVIPNSSKNAIGEFLYNLKTEGLIHYKTPVFTIGFDERAVPMEDFFVARLCYKTKKIKFLSEDAINLVFKVKGLKHE